MKKQLISVGLMLTLLILSAMSSHAVGSSSALRSADERSQDVAEQVPVLLYHDLRPEAGDGNGAVISVEEFASQMKWLYDHGYSAISTDDLFRWLWGKTQLPARSVLITFDDGYESVYQYAYPILQQYGFKAVAFVVTSLVGQRTGELTYLSWDKLQEMEASGLVEIQGHSHDAHRKLDDVPALIAWSATEIRSDLDTMNRSLMTNGLPPATAYAYPYGAFDDETVETLKAAGIRLMFTTERGYVSRDADPDELNRIIVYPGTNLCQFARLVDPDGGAAELSCSGADR